MMDVSALRSLSSISRHGTLARAAIELGYTPSAVSQQIKRLEREVGVSLLAPAGRGVVLTPAGRALVDSSGAVFAALERASSSARTVADGTPSGRVHLVAFSTAIRGLVAPALADLSGRHPDMRVEVTELDPQEALTAVDAGTADLALVHDADGISPTTAPSVRREWVHTDVGDLVVPADHVLGAREALLVPEQLQSHTWVTSPPGTVCHQWFRRLFAHGGHEPDVRHVADDFATQMSLVRAGGVIALVPRLARPPVPDGVVVRELACPPRREVHAAWRESAEMSPAVRALRSLLVRPHGEVGA